MAKLTAPLLSMDASGSIGGTLTFAKWKGRNYVRQLVTPSNPRSSGQTANRSMMKYLGQLWAPQIVLGNIIAADWQDLADQGKYSPFNAFVAFNMNRWTQFTTPVRAPATSVATPVATYTTWSATGGVRQAQLDFKVSITVTTLWGLIIFRALGGAPAGTRDEVVAIVAATQATDGVYIDTPLEPGTWHYKAMAFDTDGNQATAISGDINAVVT